MKKIDEVLAGCRSVAILGHVHPDGDCVGSCLGLYNYIRKVMPEAKTDVYLEPFQKEFAFLKGADQVRHGFETESAYELCVVCDASDRERLGKTRRFWMRPGAASASTIIRPTRALPDRRFCGQRSALPAKFSMS